jgi:hypothetical protein
MNSVARVHVSRRNQLDNPIRATMFTVAQCLAKAVELEQRAAEPHPPEVCAEFAAMAVQWRRLAARALIQDRRAAIARTLQA